ncbi:tetratricopeptide repeat protein [Helicobacter cetorum]|uniref:tetratricopeptide repeat protein n=1 Tax=Helicobacter cetorum TaxID=138563 RepID=UPI003AEF61BA
MASVYEAQGFYNESLRVCEKILEKNPNHIQALENIRRLQEKIALENKAEMIEESPIRKRKLDSTLENYILNFIKGDNVSIKTLERWLVKWN